MSITRTIIPVDEQRVREILFEELASVTGAIVQLQQHVIRLNRIAIDEGTITSAETDPTDAPAMRV